jgi:hypothetical protein
VLAEPKKRRITYVERNEFCCQFGFHPWYGTGYWCVVWPECEQSFELDEIYGLARATSMAEAENMAEANCESATERFAESEDKNARIRSRYLSCRITRTQWCF